MLSFFPPPHSWQGLEKYLMSKVWRLTFATSPEDVERDERCARILDALSFVSLDTLMGSSGVEPDPALLKVAVGELLKMDKYKVGWGEAESLVWQMKWFAVLLT